MSKSSTKLLWMSFSSVRPWNDPALWDDYLQFVESLFKDRLDRLDENDPIRRRASSRSEGLYITNFEKPQSTRILFGKFAKTKIEFTINLCNWEKDQWGRAVSNRINFYIPIPNTLSASPETDRLVNFFLLTIEKLEAFTAEADIVDIIYSKKSHDGMSLCISDELLGIFWLTYLGPKYCEFFKREIVLSLFGAHEGPAGGITIRLADSPFEIGPEERRNAEIILGEKYFAGLEPITDFNKRKIPGQLPTLEQLRAE